MSQDSARQDIMILGAGGFAEAIADQVREVAGLELTTFVEGQRRELCGTTKLGVPVIWIDDIEEHIAPGRRGICAIGSPGREHLIAKASAAGLGFATLVHPTAHIAATSSIAEGAIVCPGAVVAAHTTIGAHAIINRGALIGHHVEVGDYVTLSPGVNVGGASVIGRSAYLGMGSTILNGVTIGSGSVVGAGAVVVSDVADSVQVLGVPAVVTKHL